VGLSQAFAAAVKSAGLRPVRPHDTRHTCTTLLLSGGAPVKVVSDLLGHSSATITLGVYSHAVPGAAEQVGTALSARVLG
jgi:integrase